MIRYILFVLLFISLTVNSQENCDFARKKYLEQNPDVAKNGGDPWQHYLLYGKNEGRKWPGCNTNNIQTNQTNQTNQPIQQLNKTDLITNNIKSVDSCFLNINKSNNKPINKFYLNQSNFDFINESKLVREKLEEKKDILMKIDKLKTELNGFNPDEKTIRFEYPRITSFKDSTKKEKHLNALNYPITSLDEDEFKKILKVYCDLLDSKCDKEIVSLFDFSQSNPIIYRDNLGNYIIFSKYNKPSSSELLLFRLNQRRYDEKFIKKIENILNKIGPEDETSKKNALEKITGLTQRFFEMEKEINQLEKINEELSQKYFRISKETGSLLCGTIESENIKDFGILFNNKGDTIFIGKWINNFPDLNNGKLFQYKITKNEIYLKDTQNNLMAYQPSGDIYLGQIKDDKRHGKGFYVWPDNSYFSGDWIKGDRNGKGTYFYINGDRYEGNFLSNNPYGNGKKVFSTGEVWEGNWANDEFSGMGKQISKGGDIIDGLFDKGKLIKSSKEIKEEEDRIEQERKKQEEIRIAEENRLKAPCSHTFSKPTGLTYDYIDNRKLCCYCNKYFAQYTFKDSKNAEEIAYLSELLQLHFADLSKGQRSYGTMEILNSHKKADRERLVDFVNKNYPFQDAFTGSLLIGMGSAVNIGDAFNAAFSGKPIKTPGSKVRKVDEYVIKSKFCSNECESKCRYYDCKCN